MMIKMNVKQVIVMRRYYPDGQGGNRKLRLGKMIAQGSHASMAWLSNRMKQTQAFGGYLTFTDAEQEWLNGLFTKVVLYVDTEEELRQIEVLSRKAELSTHLITDSGLTEFNGVPTVTALAIGPDLSEKIDEITRHLPLL